MVFLQLATHRGFESHPLPSSLKKSRYVEPFKGTAEEFIAQIGVGKDSASYLKKLKSNSPTLMWWENNEKWFMNTAIKHRGVLDKPSWIIAKDLDTYINYMIKEGLCMYIERKNK